MARRRFISNGLWTNPKFVACSIPARLLFVGLVTNADDGGRLTGHPTEVRLMVFPADRFTDAKVSGLISELAGVQLVHHYSVNGDSYIEIPKFGQHQDSRYVKPSSIPPFRVPDKSSEVTDLPDSARIGQQVDDHIYVDVDDHVDVHASPPARGVPAPKAQETKAQRPRASASSSASEFAQFWQQYPRKIAKRKAEEAFRRARLRSEDQQGFLQRVLEAVSRQAASRQWLTEGGRYIPHPATWLNGDRWEDTVEMDPRAADELPRLEV